MTTRRLAEELECLQPLVVLGGELYGVARRATVPVTLVSALGVRHPMRPIASRRVWQEHWARLRRDEFLRRVAARIAEIRGVPGDLVVYFLSVLVPRVEGRDFGEEAMASSVETPNRGPSDRPGIAIGTFAQLAPPPIIPGPALVSSGRVWRLTREEMPDGVHVRVGPDTWSLAGEYLPVRVVEERWRAALDEAVWSAAKTCHMRAAETSPASVVDALDELGRTGAVQRGDLLFFGTTPPSVGHLMPQHYNISLGRSVRGDVALATTFSVAPSDAGVGGLQVFEKSMQGKWSPRRLARGICIGPGVPQRPAQLDPDLAVVAYLRWAATRIAVNEKFHEHDGRFDDE
jgi:hypothetical protein